jgi:hypothetical protein
MCQFNEASYHDTTMRYALYGFMAFLFFLISVIAGTQIYRINVYHEWRMSHPAEAAKEFTNESPGYRR